MSRMVTALGMVLLVLGSIFPLLGLSYVIYWGPAYTGGGPNSFVTATFWAGVVFLIAGLIALAFSGFGKKEGQTPSK